MLVIFNPAAGLRRRRRLERALRLLPGAEVAETRAPGHATELARAAAPGGGVVVAAGGDGTIAEVAAGLDGSDATLGLLPLGTANVLALELGMPLRPEMAADAIRHGRDLRLWPGLARDADGTPRRLFVQMLGAGLDAEVVHRLDPRLKRAVGRGAYVWGTLRELPRYGYPALEAVLDDDPPRPATSVVVSKGRLYAGRFLLAPGATPLAPGFHVALIGGGMARAALAGGLLPLNLLPRLLPGLKLRRASRVALRVPCGASVPAQADGDPAGHLPLVVEDAAAPLRVRVP